MSNGSSRKLTYNINDLVPFVLPATEGWYLKRDFLDSSLSQWQLLISELQGPDMTVADLLAAEWSKAKIFTGVRLRAVELLLLKLEDGPDVAVFVLPELCCQPWWQQFRSSTKDARWTTTWMKVPSDALVDARERPLQRLALPLWLVRFLPRQPD